ncbi:DNA sulfur modification protein DndB [Cohnella lupini]|uniref:DNA sulfur modification protein DndB n=1 Tax=Cohnella lupini TaxID=1294267 RepID=A0A3D9HQE5_9BACL|nr:DNA sulfur modification protein DndB [Cohnella lupini]RED51136.1 DNA sulfur modification protein DndB [Cohnella lupini]
MSTKTSFKLSFAGATGAQFGRRVFATTIPFETVERVLVVFPEVQRKINKVKVKAIAQYILKGLKSRNYCFLSAITATCRGDIGYEEDDNEVQLDMMARLSINDGQHRVEGIKLALKILREQVEKATGSERTEAQRRLDKLSDMSIPVVIFDSMDKVYEEQLFHDLNLLATKPTKSVSLKFDNTDLYNTMAKELKDENEKLLELGVETERTSLGEKNGEIMVLSTLRNMISYAISGSEKDKSEALTDDNYDEFKLTISNMIDSLFDALPNDCYDRSRYIIGTAATMQGIGKYYNYLINNDSIANVDEYVAGLANVDWKHSNPVLARGGFGGSFDITKNRFVFSGTGAGVNGVCNFLIQHNEPQE